MTKIYIDMDGTIARWDWVGPDVFTSRGYYATRPPMANMVNAVKRLCAMKGVEVYILSAVLQDDHSESDKNRWLDVQFGNLIPNDHRIFVPYGESKNRYVDAEGAVLVDDYNPNLWEWDGIPVKILNGINGSSGEWSGYVVDHRSAPDAIVKTLLGIARVETEDLAA